jgi:uncharacterized protein
MYVTVSNLKQGQPLEITGNLNNLEWLRKSFSSLDTKVKNFEFELTLEKKGDFVEIEGNFKGNGDIPCVRCLEPFYIEFSNKIRLFLYNEDGTYAGDGGEHELGENDLEYGLFRGDRIDVGELLREQIILSLPDYPLCKPDCKGVDANVKNALDEEGKKVFYNLKNLKLKK